MNIKNTIIAVLVIVILVIGYLFISEKTKPTDYSSAWPETEPATPTNSQTDVESTPSDDEQIQPGLYVFDTSNGNPSAGSTTKNAVISARLKQATSNPVCGNGNEYVASCEISLIDYLGNQRHVSNWPNVKLYSKYPEIFPPHELSDLAPYQMYGTNNLYVPGTLSLDGDTVFFDTRQMADCGAYNTQHWSYNITTEEYRFLSQDPGPAGDCD